MSVPLTQALGAQIFFGSNGFSRNFPRRNSGVIVLLAFRTRGRQFHGLGIGCCPEWAQQSACRPPPTSVATGRQR